MLTMFVIAAAGVSCALTFLLRRYALAKSMIDVPNARSSHTIPTPRGGGLAIVFVFMALLPTIPLLSDAPWSLMIALGGGGAIVAAVGFLDDRGHVPARWRLLSHFAAAAWVLAWLSGVPSLTTPWGAVRIGWILYPVYSLFLVWLLNLYNFMDGIDGIAGVEAITVCLGGAIMFWLVGYSGQELVLLLLAASVCGFLFWNFPPARIFMGDAGSGFLGIVLGTLALHVGLLEAQFFWAWLTLLGIFIVDATWTLLRRLVRGDKVYEAHRSHAYQFASRRNGAHLPVTLAVLGINVLWLWPWAFYIGLGGIDGMVGLILAYLPLTWLAVRYEAGGLEPA